MYVEIPQLVTVTMPASYLGKDIYSTDPGNKISNIPSYYM